MPRTNRIIQDFTGVYAEQPFMQGLRKDAVQSSAGPDAKIRWIDCSDIPGTDCYCDDEAVTAIRKQIASAGITDASGIHFFDNGNYHYMSKIWTDMVQEPFSLVVFDHHPDMQAPRFGNILSCGGWVKKVLDENQFINNVVIIGVADHLVDEIRAELSQAGDADILDKVTCIKESEVRETGTPSSFSRMRESLRSPTESGMTEGRIYISIDKDALSPTYAATNWDQGSLDIATLKEVIGGLATSHKIIGVDICGERARDFAGDEYHTVQEADALNDRINRELSEFLTSLASSPT
ncbi:Arginase family protein [Fibrobacter sp. UWR3]|uniref:arginase family protein n=1 Tax=Fibrobacter sp. UWR3 TaxID=1896217 RepID=UPI0009240C52|nr:arginase family protein [Fibrobacter sp. UWR3]SHM65574.1 Arginase family protein [Fibrobacter sp. UWR3]